MPELYVFLQTDNNNNSNTILYSVVLPVLPDREDYRVLLRHLQNYLNAGGDYQISLQGSLEEHNDIFLERFKNALIVVQGVQAKFGGNEKPHVWLIWN